jgi:hypothetical protein
MQIAPQRTSIGFGTCKCFKALGFDWEFENFSLFSWDKRRRLRTLHEGKLGSKKESFRYEDFSGIDDFRSRWSFEDFVL